MEIIFWLMLFKFSDVKIVLFEWYNVDQWERVFWELKCVNIMVCQVKLYLLIIC